MKTLAYLSMSFLSLFLFGCGSSGPIAVKGQVKFEDGKPVSQASIRFVPSGEAGRMATGYTGKDGTFDLTTFNQGDGVIPAEYVVVVSKAASVTMPAPPTTTDPAETARLMKEWYAKNRTAKQIEDPVPVVYNNEKTSPLKWKVDSASTNINLTIKR